ncbi:hypothetical protein Tco_1550383, partial [Tanacetum coccineum]
MKDSLEAKAIDFDMWTVLKAKFKKSSILYESCRHIVFHKQDQDDHSDNTLEGEKGVKKQKTTKATKCAKVQEINDDEVISEEASPEFLAELKSL